MEIRIGIVDSSKEISLDINEDLDALTKRIEESVKSQGTVLWLTDEKGKKVGIPAGKVTYVEIDPESVPRSVGFRP
ncbi:MAG: DUF3107 domain-containing protein [Actinomycetota bacterium]